MWWEPADDPVGQAKLPSTVSALGFGVPFPARSCTMGVTMRKALRQHRHSSERRLGLRREGERCVGGANRPLLAGILPDGTCGSSRTLPEERRKTSLLARSSWCDQTKKPSPPTLCPLRGAWHVGKVWRAAGGPASPQRRVVTPQRYPHSTGRARGGGEGTGDTLGLALPAAAAHPRGLSGLTGIRGKMGSQGFMGV